MQLIITARYTSAARSYGRISSHTYTGPTPPRCYITVKPSTTTTTATDTSRAYIEIYVRLNNFLRKLWTYHFLFSL